MSPPARCMMVDSTARSGHRYKGIDLRSKQNWLRFVFRSAISEEDRCGW